MDLRRWAVVKLVRYLRRRNRHLPPLPGGFTDFYDPRKLDDDTKILMMHMLAKSPMQAQRLMQKYGATTALDVLNAIPDRRHRSWWQRIGDLMRRWEGSEESDPLPGVMRREKRTKVSRFEVEYIVEDNE